MAIDRFTSVEFTGLEVRDTDKDGLVDYRDLCPYKPEDHDQFRDWDGCPELDNDRDTIVDAVDSCPNRPEVFNGYKDKDGCPDLIPELRLNVLSTDSEPIEEWSMIFPGRSSWARSPIARCPIQASR